MPERRKLSQSHPTIQLRAKRELRDAMQARATLEGMTLAGWVRFTCARELRRRKKISA
jgi:hypothetical protein